MEFEFKFPDLGEGVHEGEIVRWLVEVGDVVAPEQPLVEVMTDKVTAELPSPVAGTVIRLQGAPGDLVRVGAALVAIATEAPGIAAVAEANGAVLAGDERSLQEPAGPAAAHSAARRGSGDPGAGAVGNGREQEAL